MLNKLIDQIEKNIKIEIIVISNKKINFNNPSKKLSINKNIKLKLILIKANSNGYKKKYRSKMCQRQKFNFN